MSTNTATSARIYNKITRLEKELQHLKREAYAVIPQKLRSASRYQETLLTDAVRATRDAIWRERYAKKSARIRCTLFASLRGI